MKKAGLGEDIGDLSKISISAATVAIVSTVASLLFFVSLHVLSPEFDPSWRMVSEYALGQYGSVLSLMLICYAVGTWALALAIRPQLKTRDGKIGLAFLVVAGVGEAKAAVFNITNPLHTLTDFLRAEGLPIAAILVSVHLGRIPAWFTAKRMLIWTAVLALLSPVVLIVTLVIEAVTYQNVVGSLPNQIPKSLPPGVLAVSGWANRFLIVAYCGWAIVVAWQAIKLSRLVRAANATTNSPRR